MQLGRKLTGLTIGILAVAVAMTFGYLVWEGFSQYSTLGSGQRGKLWLATGIMCVAATLSATVFVCRVHLDPVSSLTRVTIVSLLVILVSGSGIFLRLPP